MTPHNPSAPLTFNILTLFPDMFPGTLGGSLAGKALESNLWHLNVIDMRNFADHKHNKVDDDPYGGGAGMVIRPDVVDRALKSLPDVGALYYLSPRGAPLTQGHAKKMIKNKTITLLCGRYEGIDERVLESWQAAPLSIGDYVISGGEVAAQVVADACIRLLHGVMGDADSLTEESFENGLLEYPHYTRPQDWEGKTVPDVLLSGNHAEIAQWRLDKSRQMTQKMRPDLWSAYEAKQTNKHKDANNS